MTKKRELLKEAIADAKTLKATAIANAKMALEEAFTPHLKSMFEEKIKEMDEEEEPLLEFEEEDPLLEEESETEEKEEESETEEKEEESETEEEEEFNIEDMSEDELKDFVETVIQDMVSSGELESPEIPSTDEEMPDEEMPGIDFDMDGEEDEEVDVDQLISELKRAKRQRMLKENKKTKVRKPLVKESRTPRRSVKPINSQVLARENLTLKRQLGESKRVINKLNSEMKEVNLLNAKLLYVNKLFKQTNLSEAQKMKVLDSFDKANNVRETKIIYESLVTQLAKPIAKKQIKERLGFASKPISNTKVIKENKSTSDFDNSQVNRWKFLAGLA